MPLAKPSRVSPRLRQNPRLWRFGFWPHFSSTLEGFGIST
jgi:hypothetical protein